MAATVCVEVTQSDIDCGWPGDACWCPLALALTRALGVRVLVGPNMYCKSFGGGMLPNVAQDFLRRFDAGLTVEPFQFEVAI